MAVRAASLALLLGMGQALTCPWEELWEWVGVYHVHEGGHLLWSSEKKGGAYANATMKLVIRKAWHADVSGIREQEGAAATAWAGTFIQATTNTVLRPNNAYVLNFDVDSWVSVFKIEAEAETNLAFFAEHLPTEFADRLEKFLINEEGEDMTAAADQSAASCSVEPFESGGIGEVLAASFLACVPTLMGIGLLCCACKGRLSEKVSTIIHFVNAAASGVLFGAALFLLLPEAHHMLGASFSGEAAAAAYWGSMIILGWVLGATTHHIGGVVELLGCCGGRAAPQTAADEVKEVKEEGLEEKPLKSDWAVAAPVILGDLFHNLADGMLIGAAFRACGSSFGWKLVLASLAHEVPQEMADFFVLVRKAGLKWTWATLLNFLSGLGAVLGAVIAYSAQTSNGVQGSIMAGGAGVFLFVAATELGPAVSHLRKDSSSPLLSSLMTLLLFLLGAAAIGLVLLDHEHCYAPYPGEAETGDTGSGEEDLHNGHAHR
ncbi:SLC39A12 [Symbiodinium natans]|uniref:SLC39A12 protein n=1 Tax=Symbiodinium natans TaxID=878477 RepID=A0A812QAY3_9DINO|nr:SLC39A12 [Symbiodinium natans]